MKISLLTSKKLKPKWKKTVKNSLTKEELEAELKRLKKEQEELEKNKQNQHSGSKTPSKKLWGWIIGGSLVGIIGLASLVAVLVKRKNKSKK